MAGTKRKGTIQRFRSADGKLVYRARISLKGGARVWIKVPEEYSYSEARAREFAAAQSEKAQDRELDPDAAPAPPKGETCDAWFKRVCDEKRARGLTSVDGEAYKWGKWVSPILGSKPVIEVTRDDIEDVRDALDAAIARYRETFRAKGSLSPKTAANVWGVMVSAFGQATSAKRRDLRLLADRANPCDRVLAPEKGSKKAKVYLYPGELLALLACPAVPASWKILYIVSTYLYTRPGELRALLWEDVDFAGGRVSVVKAWDIAGKRVKGTKTGEARTVPIERTLLPLLTALHTRANGRGLVAPIMGEVNEDEMAAQLRKHLRAAGVTRAALFASSASELPIRFRSLRDTGITWRAIRADDPLRIKQGAGHRGFATTETYIREAESVHVDPATVFPPVPADLLGEASLSNEVSKLMPVILNSSAVANDYESAREGSRKPPGEEE